MFLFALLVIVAFVYTIRKTPEKLVNRDQTEEWKGWMQVSIMKPKKTYLLWFPNGMLPVREEFNLDPGSLSIASLIEIKVPYEQTRTSFHVQCSNRSHVIPWPRNVKCYIRLQNWLLNTMLSRALSSCQRRIPPKTLRTMDSHLHIICINWSTTTARSLAKKEAKAEV